MTEYEALKALLAAVQTLGEFWERRVTGDQLDDSDLMDIVLNAAEHAAAGGRQPVCGHTRVVSGHKVETRSGGGNYVVYRHDDGDTIYKTSSAACGRRRRQRPAAGFPVMTGCTVGTTAGGPMTPRIGDDDV